MFIKDNHAIPVPLVMTSSGTQRIGLPEARPRTLPTISGNKELWQLLVVLTHQLPRAWSVCLCGNSRR